MSTAVVAAGVLASPASLLAAPPGATPAGAGDAAAGVGDPGPRTPPPAGPTPAGPTPGLPTPGAIPGETVPTVTDPGANPGDPPTGTPNATSAAPVAPTGPPTTPAPTTTTAPVPALVVRNDDASVAAGGSISVQPLANDSGYDATTLRVVRADRHLTATVGAGNVVVITVDAESSDQGNNVRYEVCGPAGGRCAQANIHVRIDR